ncbi:MAG: phosphoribosylformylglycinamidine synthase subunit PurQ [Deltaproteobacteria bacterium]|nr:phosphoribosylformylglycinamidine synthase subunit PurQ [Deltaproteobacteria bacterium]MBW1922110.1 phosphoribosylformylglycinamidine synthase subunit PurQ [Deltaproteobacteria bacterium]MBW1947927.1 phosphoribosylformylglycinamidine synthase subunit PurQ [Deltaproteobacteria bacterium]MBW2007338.1 phosphoribosylformylglycinamidine synthase subunit PurQ [Deltaproteobacteria bacterium]MBW2101585.1 phosphoribosylformylglycinamidine synthase subunit PurQ [Deltaproteobacteria bacterium]
MTHVKALVLTGYGLNCDYETDYSLKLAGAQSHRVHINELIGASRTGSGPALGDFHILVFGGGFSWADDHGAGVVMAAKIRRHLGEEIQRFIEEGRLIIGICNGFQCLVNLGLLPGFDQEYDKRRVALTYNDKGNFIDTWVNLRVEPDSPCVFTRGIETIELPVRHGEGKFYALAPDIARLTENRQIVMRYADREGNPARGRWPLNPNGSLEDIAGICDSTGRVFGLMPHPEAFNHWTNHPDWTRLKAVRNPAGKGFDPHQKGDGIRIFENAVRYVTATFS